ncbi:unnamed protein product, partial [Prorocentrum cordatum]
DGKLCATAAGAVEDGEVKRVILTFSGRVRVSSGSEIWSRVAEVMSAAGANIENAGGTFVQMQQRLGGGAGREGAGFSVSAFGACISPSEANASSQVAADGDGQEDLLGCTMWLKATLPSSHVNKMMQSLQTGSPLQANVPGGVVTNADLMKFMMGMNNTVGGRFKRVQDTLKKVDSKADDAPEAARRVEKTAAEVMILAQSAALGRKDMLSRPLLVMRACVDAQ